MSCHDSIATGLEHHISDLGDWIFRLIAFPDAEDNADAYFRRYYPGAAKAGFRDMIRAKCETLPQWCYAMADKYRLFDADIVGFTSMFSQTVPSLAMARLVKWERPQIVTVMGGANCEAPMGAALVGNVPSLDYAVSGPGLQALPELLRRIISGDGTRVDDIAGVLTSGNCEDERYRKSLGAERPLDDVVFPDYTAFRAAFDTHRVQDGCGDGEPVLFLETSRGCWWGQRSHCTFCGLNGGSMAYRAAAAENALKLFESAFQYYPWCRDFVAVDNIMPMEFIEDVFPRLRTPEGARIFYEVKANLDRRDMGILKASGITTIQPGIESLATSTLKLMRKGSSAFRNVTFLKNCAAFGIFPEWNLLIGFPGEEEQTYAKYCADIPLLAHLPPPQGAFLLRYDRYSPYFKNPDAYGLELEPADHYRYTYPFSEEVFQRLAYYFTDQSLSPYAIAASRWSERLNGLIRDWQERWADESARPALRMVREEGTIRITDSRFDETQTFELSPPQAELLHRLGRSSLLADVAATAQVRANLRLLLDRNLLFVEGDRAVSLVDTTGPGEDPAPRLDRGRVRPLVRIES